MAIEEVDGIVGSGVEGQSSLAGTGAQTLLTGGAGLSDRQTLFEASLAREKGNAAADRQPKIILAQALPQQLPPEGRRCRKASRRSGSPET